MNKLPALVPLLLWPLAGILPAQTNWPQFRGADARGVAGQPALPDHWSATENVAWKTDLPGRGWSSPIVWGNRVFLTTVINTGSLEPPKKGLYFGGNREKPTNRHEWWACCLDLESGRTEWKRKLHDAVPETAIHLKGSYAAETPVTDGGRVYFYFGNVGVFTFTLAGEPVWTRPIDARPTRFGWGHAASPVLHEDRLYLVNDNERDSFLLALNKHTGETVWRVERKEGSNWSTPYVWKHKSRTEIVTPGSDLTRSYDLDGKLLWQFRGGMSSITIATPFADDDHLYLSSGYVGGPLKPIYAIRPGATGDISLPRDQTSSRHIAWCQWNAAPYNPGTLLYRDRLYSLLDRGMLSALDSKTGRILYDKARIPNAGGFTSSPWANDGKIFCLNEDGVTFVFAAGDTFRLLHQNRLANDDMCMATPALAGDRLLIRTSARLYCLRKRD